MLKIISGIAEGQVLQRGDDGFAVAEIEGFSDSTGEFSICMKGRKNRSSIGRSVVSVDRKSCHFHALLSELPVGGPYELCVSAGSEEINVKDIYVGDVWLLGGQSNMEGVGRMAKPSRPNPLIRALYMDREWRVAKEPLHVPTDSPDQVHYSGINTSQARERWREFSKGRCGLGVFFAKEMLRRSGNVPQGLICTAHGGTSMSDWDPALRNKNGKSFYGSMLMSWKATGQPVAGILWHQGENDASGDAPKFYSERMTGFIKAIRRDLKQSRLPFILAQLGRYHTEDSDPSGWKSIQHQQLMLAKTIHDLECVSTIDLELDDCIHIGLAGHRRLGVRFARMADRLVYGNKKELPPPQLISAKRIKGNRHLEHGIVVVELLFKNSVGGFRSSGTPCGFAFVDEKGVEVPVIYKTTLEGNLIRIEAMNRGKLLSYHLVYGAGFAPRCSITDGRDMALPVMDKIKIDNMEQDGFFVLDWMVSDLLPSPSDFLSLTLPDMTIAKTFSRRVFKAPFFNLSGEGAGRSGMVYGMAKIEAPQDSDAKFFIGYDGPFKLWLDTKPIFQDAEGLNPIIIDEHTFCVRLSKGIHEIVAAYDNNNGMGWGFALRIFYPKTQSSQRMTD